MLLKFVVAYCIRVCVQPVKQILLHFSSYTGLTWKEAKEQCPKGVVPACHNTEKTVTISGPLKDVQDFVTSLKERGVFAREVNSSGVAFHSYFMDQVAPLIKDKLSKVGILTLKHC